MHSVLHGFRAGGEIGAAIMELNFYQELASIDQDPLFLLFLDLRKSYDTVDQERLLVRNIRDLLGLSTGGAKTELISRTGFTRHNG